MTALLLLRHAPTAWNREGRMQGRTDIALLPESRADLARCRLPGEFAQFRVLCSPLKRCLETAAALRLTAAIDPRLIEMDWGEFEGRTLATLRAEHGEALAANEARGLDFRPDGGESPREVGQRVASLLAEIAQREQPCLVVTHRGVIRAIYARAVGWDMMGKPPHALDPHALHLFRLERDGTPRFARANIPLETV
jgi:broad specificity phosphatase PhoE